MKMNTRKLTQAVFLAAFGIIIPLIMPKIVISDAASYTLASHVPLFIAMFISPPVTFLVGSGIGAGFFLSGLPLPITVRALSHLLWAVPASFLYLKKRNMLMTLKVAVIFCIILSAIHALLEVVVVLPFYTDDLGEATFFLKTIFLPIGIGGFVHSIIDFFISFIVYKRIEFIIFPEQDTETIN